MPATITLFSGGKEYFKYRPTRLPHLPAKSDLVRQAGEIRFGGQESNPKICKTTFCLPASLHTEDMQAGHRHPSRD
ncbi:MAG: hypothetical protein KJ666_10375 [Bacteroidetes bacterium]|nr:hypothetical protein [Bacteroidota bacterium]MBU2583924.1 hypothetical protein [Bacteroidota bacterium]